MEVNLDTKNLTGYIVPPTSASPLLTSAAPTEPSVAVESVASTEPGSLSRLFNWVKKLFGYGLEAEKSEAEVPYERARFEDYIRQTAEIERHRKENLEEEFSALLTEAGLDRAFVLAQVANLNLRKKELIFDDEEMKQIWSLAQEFKAKIDAALKEKLANGQTAAFLGKIETGTAILTLSLALVMTGVAVVSGGTAPALLAGIKMAAEFSLGASKIAGSYYHYQGKKAAADYQGASEQRRQKVAHVEDYLDRMQQSSESVAASWKEIRAAEERKSEILKSLIMES